MTLDDYLKPLDVHELQYQPLQSVLPTVVVGLGIFLLQLLNLFLVVWAGLPLLIGFLFHLAMAAACFFYAAALKRLGRDTRFALLLALTVLAMGPFGALGSVIGVLLAVFYGRYTQSFSEWFATIFPQPNPTLPETVHDQISTGRDLSHKPYSVIPFMEVMALGSEQQKRSALSRMTLLFHPSFAGAYKKALTDPSNAIRVQAATAVTRIENRFLEGSMKLHQVVKLFPDNPRVKLALAKHYDDYAFTGVLDPEREHQNRAKALEAYMEYLKSQPQDVEARLAVGRLLMRSGDTAAAADWFQKCLNEKFISPSIVIWMLECLFKLGRFRELRSMAGTYFAYISEPMANRHDILDVIKLWLGDTSSTPRPLQGATA